LSELKKYNPPGNLNFNSLGIFQSSKLLISMEKILSISLKLNFTPNTLGCYRLKKACAKDEMIVFWMVKGESILSLFK